ncbi:MAG TPA: winged helix-turn-helix domain-containing protein [Candidatus Tumulicola sp.]|jgi:DNA-binding winged helix-turn-helix (wHTH) protein/Tfp pilus assembly protein PilF
MSVYEFGPFQLDAERLLLLEAGIPIALGPKVVETLLALVERPGDVLTKTALLDRIWPEGYVDEANLAQNVYVLRKMLRAYGNFEAIETIPRRGYRFVAAVAQRDSVPPAQPARAAAKTRRRFVWQIGLAAALAMALSGGMAFALLSPPSRSSPDRPLSAEGARLYQIGRYYWNLRTPGSIAKSLSYFARVIDTDPLDARGYGALASADAIMGDYGYGPLPRGVYFARARAYASKALSIDPKYGEAYAVLGMLSSEKKDAKQMTLAVSQLQHAIALDPSSGPAHEWYGVALFERGRFREAYAELRKAAELDPLSVATAAWLGNAAYLERQYGAAIDYAHEALDLAPQRSEVYETLGLAYEARGDRPRAIAAFRRLAVECPHCRAQAAALLAEAYAKAKRPADARAELAIARAHVRDVDPGDFAIALAAVGERSDALSWLRRTGGDAYLRAEIASDPRFDLLRNELELARVQKPA